MITNKIFDLLDLWRKLPSYQLERRADIFFAVFLDKIIKNKVGIEIDYIIPEFPIRIGNISKNHSELNKSFKVDYLVYSSSSKKVLLIELKTDQTSRKEKQDWYLEEASKLKVSGLVDGIIQIYNATNQKRKYNNLLDLIEKLGWIKKEDSIIRNLNIDLIPEIFYIQPINIKGEKNVITFENIRDYLFETDEPIAKRFIASLEKWEINPND